MDQAKQDELKKAAAKKAAALVEDGMVLGVGTGSTVKFFIDADCPLLLYMNEFLILIIRKDSKLTTPMNFFVSERLLQMNMVMWGFLQMIAH